MTTDTLIACSALGLSLYGVIASNRNNRLSVRPHLVAKRYFDWTDAGFVFSYDLSNHGFGPARLKKFILLLDGKPFSCQNTNLVEEFFGARLKGKLEYQIPKFGHPNKDIASSKFKSLVQRALMRSNWTSFLKAWIYELNTSPFTGKNSSSIRGFKVRVTQTSWVEDLNFRKRYNRLRRFVPDLALTRFAPVPINSKTK
jgi:hypothetical protein